MAKLLPILRSLYSSFATEVAIIHWGERAPMSFPKLRTAHVKNFLRFTQEIGLWHVDQIFPKTNLTSSWQRLFCYDYFKLWTRPGVHLLEQTLHLQTFPFFCPVLHELGLPLASNFCSKDFLYNLQQPLLFVRSVPNFVDFNYLIRTSNCMLKLGSEPNCLKTTFSVRVMHKPLILFSGYIWHKAKAVFHLSLRVILGTCTDHGVGYYTTRFRSILWFPWN